MTKIWVVGGVITATGERILIHWDDGTVRAFKSQAQAERYLANHPAPVGVDAFVFEMEGEPQTKH
jgi:hypothetical protein